MSVYVKGRYLKFERGLPQSPWYIGRERRGTTSVEEYLSAPVLAHFGSSRAKLISGGREDIDVRMLGNGRPFVLEIIEPKESKSIEAWSSEEGAADACARLSGRPKGA